MRCLGIIGAAFIAGYGITGVLRDDLAVSVSKSGAGVHLHGPLAWLCCVGMLMMSSGLIRFLAPKRNEAGFDFDARRRRFGPPVVLGLALYLLSQLIAHLRT